MQINFNPKKLKEAKEYVNLLQPPVIKKVMRKEKSSLLQKFFNKLFRSSSNKL